jgi:hypothetical protein
MMRASERDCAAGMTMCVAVCLALLGGCGSGSAQGSANGTAAATYAMQTPVVTVAAGQERYVCYAKTLDQDLAVDRFDYAVKKYVHHLFLSRAMQPEPDGLSECDVLFRTSWVPLFVAGNGTATLAYPQGAASVLPKGAQIVLQMHLLNAGSNDAAVSVDVDMRRSTIANPKPVGLYAFGTQRISLPPNASSTVSYECTPNQDVQPFTVLVHMHRLGTRMTLEAADSTGAYQEIFRRDPYDFDNQFLDDSVALQIPKGTKTRITCTYNNTRSVAVGYGESTNSEMCFLATFVQGQNGPSGCIDTASAGDGGSVGDAGACMPTANALGVGAACTAGGGECGAGLQCSADVNSTSASSGFCLKVGCVVTADCGQGATCCAPAQGGGAVQVCLPSACVPSDCAVK